MKRLQKLTNKCPLKTFFIGSLTAATVLHLFEKRYILIKWLNPRNKSELGKISSQGEINQISKSGWRMRRKLFKVFFQPPSWFHSWWLEKSTALFSCLSDAIWRDLFKSKKAGAFKLIGSVNTKNYFPPPLNMLKIRQTIICPT